MILRCTKHGIRAEIDPERNERKFEFPANRPYGPMLCALLLSRNPQPGRIYVQDDQGRNTAVYCDVEEVI